MFTFITVSILLSTYAFSVALGSCHTGGFPLHFLLHPLLQEVNSETGVVHYWNCVRDFFLGHILETKLFSYFQTQSLNLTGL